MSGVEIVKLAIAGFISAIFLMIYVYTICLLFGKGGKGIAGYHVSNRETTAKDEHKYILRRLGVCLFALSAAMHTTIILFLFGYYIGGGVMAALSLAGVVLVLYIANTKKMKIKEKIVRKSKPNKDSKGDVDNNTELEGKKKIGN